MIILGIETSCDETAAAVVDGRGGRVKVLSNVVSSQIDIHKQYGGVVPEVAAREHVGTIIPVIEQALEKADIDIEFLRSRGRRKKGTRRLNALAVANGPGLITSLIVGVETAKTLAAAWDLPISAVNHVEGHIYANFIDTGFNTRITDKCFPAIVLTVSGGHTLLVLMRGHGDMEIIGETRDDAAGEAFDKAAAMLGIGYPGGPAVSALAEKFQDTNSKKQINSIISLPRPMIHDKSFDFSFSGLKTALLYELRKDNTWKKRIPEYCFEFERAVVDVLVAKTVRAAEACGAKTVMLSGGVAANRVLRLELERAVKEKLKKTGFRLPDLKYTTDNAAMAVAAGYFRALRKDFMPWEKLRAESNLGL